MECITISNTHIHYVNGMKCITISNTHTYTYIYHDSHSMSFSLRTQVPGGLLHYITLQEFGPTGLVVVEGHRQDICTWEISLSTFLSLSVLSWAEFWESPRVGVFRRWSSFLSASWSDPRRSDLIPWASGTGEFNWWHYVNRMECITISNTHTYTT